MLGQQLAVALVRLGDAEPRPGEGLEHGHAAVLVHVGVAGGERLGEELAEPRLVALALGPGRRDDGAVLARQRGNESAARARRVDEDHLLRGEAPRQPREVRRRQVGPGQVEPRLAGCRRAVADEDDEHAVAGPGLRGQPRDGGVDGVARRSAADAGLVARRILAEVDDAVRRQRVAVLRRVHDGRRPPVEALGVLVIASEAHDDEHVAALRERRRRTAASDSTIAAATAGAARSGAGKPSAAGPVRDVPICARVTFAGPPCAQMGSARPPTADDPRSRSRRSLQQADHGSPTFRRRNHSPPTRPTSSARTMGMSQRSFSWTTVTPRPR